MHKQLESAWFFHFSVNIISNPAKDSERQPKQIFPLSSSVFCSDTFSESTMDTAEIERTLHINYNKKTFKLKNKIKLYTSKNEYSTGN